MLLNIDELIGEPRVLLWKGKEYEVKELTLKIFLELQAKGEGLSNEEMTSVIQKLVPGLDMQEFPLRLLPQIFEFVITSDEKKSPTAEAPEAAK